VREGWRPALIFNSTIVETGEPLLLATTDIQPGGPPNEPNWRSLADIFPDCKNCDIPVVTAVRLAASFPFVTPASRAISQGVPYHVVDGGYYDNYGVYSLLEWLREAMRSVPETEQPDILIVQIRSFPDDARAQGEGQGWFYQMEAPVKALMAVRTAGQLLRDRDALQHFVDEIVPDTRIKVATFEFAGTGAPLSWQMNQEQKEAIRHSWRDRINGAHNQDWWVVSCFFHPVGAECENLKRAGKKGVW
jgi:hypothetical protein